MNIGETKEEFKKDVKTEDFEIIETKKFHLNVSRITARVGWRTVQFGYSYNTIVGFSVMGYSFITKEIFLTSTQKHKSQISLEGKNSYLPRTLFGLILGKIMRGEEITKEDVIIHCEENNIQIINTNSYKNIFDYLYNHEFVEKYELHKEIKELISRKARNKTKTTLSFKNKICSIKTKRIRDENEPWKTNYLYSFEKKEYKNLSFLNKLELENLEGIK